MTVRLHQVLHARTLAGSAQNAHSAWSERHAIVITLESDRGRRGWGEAAPLPGFSPDTLADCADAFRTLDPTDLPERLAPGQVVLESLARASARLPSTLPAARAALESALLDLWSRQAGVPAWALLCGDTRTPSPRRLAALLMGEPEEALDQARAARARGLNAFKFKVGRARAFERELRAVSALRAELGASAALRLDANRAWPPEAAREHLGRLAEYHPEFVEEPSAFSSSAEFGPNPVPLALDESLVELAPGSVNVGEFRRLGVRALILKPSLLGGISACAAWARVARECGAEAIFSHLFEGPLGLTTSATLALCFGSEHAAHGLDLPGTRLGREHLPYWFGPEIQASSEPGFGDPKHWDREYPK